MRMPNRLSAGCRPSGGILVMPVYSSSRAASRLGAINSAHPSWNARTLGIAGGLQVNPKFRRRAELGHA
jgi:hypothetical protein